MLPQTQQHVYQEADELNPALVHAHRVTAIIITQILIQNSINFEILVQKEAPVRSMSVRTKLYILESSIC